MSASSRPKVLVTTRIPQGVLQQLKERLDVEHFDSEDVMPKDKLIESIQDKDGIFCILENKIDQDVVKAGRNLKVVSTMSVGYDHVDVRACKDKGIAVGNTPGVLTETTADLALALILATARRITEAAASVHSGEWGSWRPLWLCGVDVHSSTVGIVGMGRIGAATARRLKGFGCKILYTATGPKPDLSQSLDAEYVTLDELLARSDIVSVHCP
eukprot:TRINITY_DN6550_c0_g1_i1.p1 TRINITY_DN6550_c0_g1~~TRINITY_DN6550_c0_g1_i1.p1  ORF type:complete len:214 (-),score=50.86 TRINITY_DN6550_c0_g1_i1:50-691(-)